MRQRFTAVFATIVTAFVALNLLVLFSLWPQLQRSEALSTQFARNASLLARMRGDIHTIRTAATQLHVQARAGVENSGVREELERARRDFDAAAAAYEATAPVPGEDEVWGTLSLGEYPEFASLAGEAARPTAGDAAPDQALLTALGDAATQVDVALQELAELNAEALDARGAEIHDTVRALVLACLALGAVGIVGGVVLVRWALRALRDYERSTHERMQELDDFAGRVAHDLRNPLQAIGLSLSVIQRRTQDERTLATCAKAEQGAKRMASFIQELLTFARSGATPAPGACAHVASVMSEIEQDLAPQADSRGVRLVVRPQGDGHAAISPEALRAIVGNLADNAVKHMGADGAERLVELSSAARPGEVEITVRDTGVGIPPEALPRVWDHFFRATDRPGGLGIGLRTVKRLVDAHRGRIEVESHVGRGSRFTVVLPAAPAPEAARSDAPAESARDAT